MPHLSSTPKKSHRRLLLVAVSVLPIVVLLAFNASDPATESSTSEVTVQTVVDRRIAEMLEAAQSGDVSGYLKCFDGTLHETLARRLQEKNLAAASTELKAAESDLRSFVISDWTEPKPDEVMLVLERIYSGFNKRHRVRLRRFDTTWKIVQLSELDRQAPDIPYGTPVFRKGEEVRGAK